jgi:division protein CdvB (Snf7/Vps24/ESCRT-III family)
LQQQIDDTTAELEKLRLDVANNAPGADHEATASLSLELAECKAIIRKYGTRLEQASTLIDTLEKDLQAAVAERDAAKADLSAHKSNAGECVAISI